MKKLFLLRHAKSSWDDAALADIDRPLNERGKLAAPFMGGLMRRLDLIPDLILTSPAKRARGTAKLVKEAGAFEVMIVTDERIYEASPNNLHQIVSEITDQNNSVVLVGHNPGIEGFVRFLTGKVEPMPTAALAVIDLAVEHWSEVGEGCGTVVKIHRPKQEMG